MFCPQLGTRNLRRALPVVRYAPGARLPGASHAAAPSQTRSRLPWRLLCLLPLLPGMVASLRLLQPARLVPARSPAAQAAAPQPAPASHSTTHWDSLLTAAPRRGQFIRFFRMRATAYTPINTRMEGGRYTYTLRDGRAVHGVAVDPGLIPLGSHLWIPGYGHAVADDIGGRIHGHHIDLRVQKWEHMNRWGMRPVRVYVLREP